VKLARIGPFVWPDLRHCFASRLVMGGVDLRTVAELLGHRTLQMVMRYAHLAPGHVRQAVDRLVAQPSQNATDTKTDTARKWVPLVSVLIRDIKFCLLGCYSTVRKWRNGQTRRT
jgi:integrase